MSSAGRSTQKDDLGPDVRTAHLSRDQGPDGPDDQRTHGQGLCPLFQAVAPDVVYRHSGSIEVHNPVGKGTSKIGHKRGEWHQVPLRAYIVKGFVNLMVAGRCFSVDPATLSATRSIGLTMMLGEAVGYAVALAHKYGVSVCDIPVDELQRKIDLPEPDTLPVFHYYEDEIP